MPAKPPGRAGPTGSPHRHIIEIAGNDLLASALEPLEGRMRRPFQQIDDPHSVRASPLYEAIAASDAEAAARLAPAHVRHYRAVLLGPLFGEPGP
ncbi:FCD domain-containing protein [Streptomyces sp. NPDC002540]